MSKQCFFDLHCDTLTAFGSLDDDRAAWSLGRLPQGAGWAQCFAVFLPDDVRGERAVAFYERYRDCFFAQTRRNAGRVSRCETAGEIADALEAGRCAAILTVESGAALAGDLARVQKLREDGVRMMTLTWNGENELGCGQTDPSRGLTAFGRAAVREMERCGVLVDVSHLSDRGFSDVCGLAQRPFVASHSNARAVCPHPRNLTDEQIAELVRRGGLIGLNFYAEFLGGDTPEALYRHISHFLGLGAQRALALGSDYDGARIPAFLDRPDKLPRAAEYLLSRGIAEETLRDLLGGNARRFFDAWL